MAPQTILVEDEPIPGIAQICEEHADADPAALAAVLQERTSTIDVGLPGARSSERFASIIEKIRGRTLLDDFGVHPFTVEWFAFHVPPGGKGRLKIKHTKVGDLSVGLKVVGLGFGAGRKLTLAVEDDYGERSSCLRLRRTFAGHFRAYQYRSGRPYIQVDVTQVLKDEQSSQSDCDLCCIGEARTEKGAAAAGITIDLTADPHGRTLSDVLTIEESKELDISLPLKFPNFDIAPGVAIKRDVSLVCSYGYTLPGGYSFTPYQETGGWTSFPFWLRT